MGHFDRDNNSGGKFDRPRFGGGGRGGFNRGGDRPFMHKATCATCGNECEVPFKPTGDRPVYCSNCFKKGDNPAPSKFGGNFRERPSFGEKRSFTPPSQNNDQLKAQFEALNSKLDKILQALVPAAAVKAESAMPVKAVEKKEEAVEAKNAKKAKVSIGSPKAKAPAKKKKK